MDVLIELAKKYNNLEYFKSDPIIYPRHFAKLYSNKKAKLQDVEITGLLCAHLAWGRRDIIVRDCGRLLEEMRWEPFNYVMKGKYRDDNSSLHRTIKWCDMALIMNNLKEYYSIEESLETLPVNEIRTRIFNQKANLKAANKKIHMFRRWMVRDDNIVDTGVWKTISPSELIIPLDVHVHRNAIELGITTRKTADITTAIQITQFLETIFPGDPCKGDFALFAYSASNPGNNLNFENISILKEKKNSMANLYIIAGCNGAGKTTASYTILPEMLSCKEFVNADEIARGISPFKPESVSIQAGKIMLERIKNLISSGTDFALETTLATRTHANVIKYAQAKGYKITLVFFWLNMPSLAVERVKMRVASGGHHIEEKVIRRRYDIGIKNLFSLYIPLCEYWMVINNSSIPQELIVEGGKKLETKIYNKTTYNKIANYERNRD